MCQFSQKVIKELDINIELFFQKLDSLSNKNQLTEIDKTIICQSLLGYSRQQIAKNLVNLSEQQIVLRTLEKHDKYIQDSQSLLIKMNQYFKEQKKQVRGVTGIIEFDENGDRINPPTEIVSIKWDAKQQKWKWTV